MSQGVVYLFSGMGAAERLVVSVFSLRKHYDGEVAVFTTGDDERQLVEEMAPTLGVKSAPIPRIGHRHGQFVTKSAMSKWSPFDANVYLDADTLVCKPLDYLFEKAADGLVVTEFAGWISTGRKMSGRIIGAAHKPDIDHRQEFLSGYIEALCQEQVRTKPTSKAEIPAINTGVMGWRKGFPGMALWHAVTMAVGHRFIADELAMQLILPNVGATVADHIYNASPIHSEWGNGQRYDKEDVVIWHFHGRKHVKREQGAEIWVPAFEEARAAKIARIQRWAGRHDKTVRAYLRGGN